MLLWNVSTITGDVMDYASNFDFSNPSWDLFIVIFFVVGSLLYGFSLGRTRVIVLLVSMYIALAIANSAPYLNQLNFSTKINIENWGTLKITTFVGMFVMLFFVLSRSALIKSINDDTQGKWWQILLFSFLQVGLLISIILSYLPHNVSGNLAALTQNVFASEAGRLAWLVLPVFAMMLVRKSKDED